MRTISRAILTDGRHDEWIATEQLQVIRDIASASAKLAAHFRYKKAHIDFMQLVRQQGFGKTALERHDRIEGEGTADE